VAEVPHVGPPVEAGSSAPVEPAEVKPEPQTSDKHKTEEKGSTEEEKTSAKVPPTEPGTSGDKLKVYNGRGRRHTDDQIDEILDEYLQYGNLPKYVSERQRRDYRKHKRLPLRRMYLEQAGLIKLLGT
jgi:hypothetical protein